MPEPLSLLEHSEFDAAAAVAAARFFDAEYVDYREDIPILEAYAQRCNGLVLELGCGTGRALVPLARRGHLVTGIDLSQAMLDVARARAERAGVLRRVNLLLGDFTRAPLGGPYALACILMNTFMHLLTQRDQLRALDHWRSHMQPGGLLIIDLFNPDVSQLSALAGQVEFDKSWVDPATGATVMKQLIRTVDLAEQRMHVIMIYDEIYSNGEMRRTIVPFAIRYLWRFEAELLLERSGFALEGIYGDWDHAAFDSASERMILVARRRD